jgi:hypothetical protein
MGLSAQLIEQRLGVLQIGGVEALGEPVVDLAITPNWIHLLI